jgi:ComF family protein
MRHKLLSIAQSIRLPSICILCNQVHKNTLAVCSHCIALITPLGPSCQHCAYPLYDDSHLICGYCIKKPPHFDNAIIAYRFEEPLRSLLHRFKYHAGLYLGPFLGQLILNAWQKRPSQPQCLIPVPMHPKKLKIRGFNQSAILVQFLAKKLNLPYDLKCCQKIINTSPQAQLDGDKRAQNIRNAFHIKPLPYSHVAIIDDLLTTGCTANELAKMLKNAGVKQVDVWCCARTISGSVSTRLV